MANLIRTFELKNNYLDNDEPWSGILSATSFEVQSTHHNMLQATPGQLVFGHDMILNTPFVADWGSIRLSKHKIMYKNNQLENKNLKPHTYIIWDEVLVRNKKVHKYEEPYVGPYLITQVWTNVNVTIHRGAVQERINIIWIKPYH